VNAPIEIVGFLALSVTGFQVIRQAHDVSRSDSPTGVSAWTWILVVGQSAGLGVLAVAEGRLAALASNLLAGLCGVAIISHLASTRHRIAAYALPTAALGLAILATTRVAGAPAAGTLGAGLSVVVWVPQAVRSLSRRDPQGLSWVGLMAGITSSLLWLVYAIGAGEWRFALAPIAAICALAITGLAAIGGPTGKSSGT